MIFPLLSSRMVSLDAYEQHCVSSSRFKRRGTSPSYPSARNQEVIAIILIDFEVAYTNLDIQVRAGSFGSKDALGVINVEPTLWKAVGAHLDHPRDNAGVRTAP